MLEKLQLGLASVLVIGGALACSVDCAIAQIVPDATLGAESSVVTPNAGSLPIDLIQGGATRDANLFHSFEQFSVLTGREAFFNNATDIQNIISRVTGASGSNIDGLIRANGTANLFLINPNGIIFGSNASLSIGGSFLASTASSINFADDTQFRATAPQTTLLTVSVPIGLQYGGTAREVLLQGSNLAVQPDKTLALVGGNITLAAGELMAEGGRIELGSVASNSLVSLPPTEKGWSLGYEGAQNFQDIQLSQQAVDASGEGGGDIQVQGRRVTLTDGAQIETTTLGAEPGGTLSVTASESVELSGRSSRLVTSTEGAGAGGNLIINTGRLTVRDGGQVRATTEDAGLGGTLTVNASELVEAIGLNSESGQRSQLTTRVGRRGTGDGGELTVETRRLIVKDGARVETGTSFRGSAGDLTVRASGSVEVSGAVQLSPGADLDRTFLSTTAADEPQGGNAGNLTVETRRLIVRDGARLNTSTFGEGSAGNLTVRASESVEVSGGFTFKDEEGEDRFEDSRLATRTTRTGKGGNLLVETGQLTLRDGAQVNVSSERTGNGGNLTIRTRQLSLLNGARLNAGSEREGNGGNLTVEADLITLDNQSSIEAIAENREGAGTGNAGNLTIQTGQLVLRNGAKVNVSATETGNAGTLTVEASSIKLDNQSSIEATTAAGNQGNIILRSQDVVLRNGSFITTNATGTATGGNIDIDTDVIAALEDSDISADADEASGGRVIINAQGIFGTEFRITDTPESDITATSNLGPQFSGTVEINTPDVDPNQGLVALPTELVDASNQIAAGCAAGGESVASNKFIITGRGGLPPSPTESLNGDSVLTHWATLDPIENRSSAASSNEATTGIAPSQIVEANGWAIAPDGEVILTASAPNVTATTGLISTSCNGS